MDQQSYEIEIIVANARERHTFYAEYRSYAGDAEATGHELLNELLRAVGRGRLSIIENDAR